MIKIKQQSRKSLAMKMTTKGIEVLIPHQLNPDSERVQTFIDKGLQKLNAPLTAAKTLSKSEILTLVEQYSQRLSVEVKRIQFQPMRQKWGSISTAGNLTLANDLLELPTHLVEYVVCHELLHLQIPYHNRLYYLRLSQIFPDWSRREQALARWGLGTE